MFQRQDSARRLAEKPVATLAPIIGDPFLREKGTPVCGVSSALPVSKVSGLMSICRGIRHLKVGEEWISYSPGEARSLILDTLDEEK